MERPNLGGRVPDAIGTRLPGGTSDEGSAATTRPGDDGGDREDDSTSRTLTTLLTLSGLGLATLGVVLRYVLDRRGDGGDDDLDHDPSTVDRSNRGTVEIVGDEDDTAEPDDGSTAEPGDVGAIDAASTGEGDSGLAEETTGIGDDAETQTDASSVDAAAVSDVRVDTFGAGRLDDVADGEGDDDASREGPPRIAPLVGIVALVGMRLIVERLRERTGTDPDATAPQL